MSGPLQGVRILDLTTGIAAPLAAQLLGDFGADVIKVDPPQGDTMRHYTANEIAAMLDSHAAVAAGCLPGTA